MNENKWNLSLSESVQERLKRLDQIHISNSALAMSQGWMSAIPDYKLNSFHTAVSEVVARQNVWSEMMLPASAISARIAAVCPTLNMDVSNVIQSFRAQIDTSMFYSLSKTVSLAALEKADWSWLSEVYSKENDEQNNPSPMVEEKEVAPEIRAEMAADIAEVISEPETIHLTSQNKYLEWVKKHPDFAMQFLALLLTFIQTICTIFSTWQAHLVKNSQVYQEPASTSNVVYNLKVENNVTVIGDVPYYYEIEFINPETGELVVGYIYKGNIIAEEPDKAESPKEEIDTAEVSESISNATLNQVELNE